MIEINSNNVELLKNEFPSVGEIKKDLSLYELQQDDLLSLSERENINTHRATKDSVIPVFGRDDKTMLPKRIKP